jgi:hypothetical protein
MCVRKMLLLPLIAIACMLIVEPVAAQNPPPECALCWKRLDPCGGVIEAQCQGNWANGFRGCIEIHDYELPMHDCFDGITPCIEDIPAEDLAPVYLFEGGELIFDAHGDIVTNIVPCAAKMAAEKPWLLRPEVNSIEASGGLINEERTDGR